MNTINFDELSKQIFEQNKAIGWWDDMDRCIYQTLQLVSTEIAEATEGERKNLMDDKIKHRRMGEVELADALIRILDLAGRYEWVYCSSDCMLTTTRRMLDSIKTIAGLHFVANKVLAELGVQIFDCINTEVHCEYSELVQVILKIGEIQNYDIIGAMHEKIEFNKNRPDHNRENRAAENGKKF